MKKKLIGCISTMATVFWVSGAAANSINVNFAQASGESALSEQMQLTITGSSGETDQILFSFTNNVGIASSMDTIYIDGTGLFTSVDNLYPSTGVNFVTDGWPSAEGGVFSGEQPFGFWAKKPENGIDRAGESLGIVFNLSDGVTLDTIAGRLQSESPFIEIRNSLCCPSYFNPVMDNINPPMGNGTQPVPEPASLILFGIGTAGLAGWTKRRLAKEEGSGQKV